MPLVKVKEDESFENALRRYGFVYIAGVDDLWWGRPNLHQALSGVPPLAPVVLLSHNPDFAEDAPDSRVGLILSGHTHGGQI